MAHDARIRRIKFAATLISILALLSTGSAQEIAPVITVRADHVLTTKAPVVLCDASRGHVTLTLPQPEARRSISFTVKKIDATPNECRFSQRVDNGMMPGLSRQYQATTVLSVAGAWWAR